MKMFILKHGLYITSLHFYFSNFLIKNKKKINFSFFHTLFCIQCYLKNDKTNISTHKTHKVNGKLISSDVM